MNEFTDQEKEILELLPIDSAKSMPVSEVFKKVILFSTESDVAMTVLDLFKRKVVDRRKNARTGWLEYWLAVEVESQIEPSAEAPAPVQPAAAAPEQPKKRGPKPGAKKANSTMMTPAEFAQLTPKTETIITGEPAEVQIERIERVAEDFIQHHPLGIELDATVNPFRAAVFTDGCLVFEGMLTGNEFSPEQTKLLARVLCKHFDIPLLGKQLD